MADNEPHNDNDAIEEFFRDHLEQYRVPYEEDDWLALEQRLDGIKSQRAARRWKYAAAASLALLLGLLGYLTYQNQALMDRLDEQVAANEQLQQPPQHSGEVPGAADEQTTRDSASAADRELANQQRPPAATPPDREEPAIAAPPEAPGQLAGSREWAISRAASNQLFVNQLECPNCSVMGGLKADGQRADTPSLAGALAEVPAAPGPVSGTADGEQPPYTYNSTGTESAMPRLTFGFVAAPDLSTAGSLANFDDPGYALGVTAGLRLSRRIVLSTGLIRVRVNYQARGSEYRPPAGYWSGDLAAMRTYAECVLLDIPLNLRYDLHVGGQSRLYVQAGLSSYIMLNEEYQFRYEGYPQDAPDRWSGRTGTTHWFSNAGLSVGYGWEVSPGWSLQVEPYIKVPLQGVGWGDVNLYSVGSRVSVNYAIW